MRIPSSPDFDHKKTPRISSQGFFTIELAEQVRRLYTVHYALAARRSFSSKITFSETDAGQGR